MAQATQANRHIAIGTPLGEDVLLLQSFSGQEKISSLFEFDLNLLSENYEINFDEIIGQNVTIRMELPDGGTRYWNGFINRFEQGRSTSTQFAQYRATMVPWLWFLTRTSDCRIFQEKTVPDIVKQVFNDLGFSDIEDRLSGGYRTWTYCVQYRETDFNFVSRLMEQEGIFYYFHHEEGKCTIVLCDSMSKLDPWEDYEEMDYTPDTHSSTIQERISEWGVHKYIRPGKWAHTDYDFKKPSTSLMSTATEIKSHDGADFEIYDYPGEYSEKADGDRYAQVRMEELAQSYEICEGQADSRGICTGYLFTLAKHTRPDQNREYLVLSTHYQASAEDYETSGGGSDLCACSFTVIPTSVQYRPERKTPKPIIQGTQTAIVTGPSGEEIHTDEHGRIKVQFHWDREGKYDENSSCWIRVSQNWAGKSWGAIFLPRIGHEVIVSFLEGDPDQPIVTGRVYHGENKPPYSLPGEKTKSTVKSNSSIGGGGFNEIRFEDKKGEEQIFVHAEKNQDIRVKSDRYEWIGHDRHLIVKHDKFEEVENNRSEKVKQDHYEEIGKDRHVKVVGKEAKEVGGSKSLTVKGDVIEVFKANHSEQTSGDYYLKASNIVIEGTSNVTVKVGGSHVAIESGGIKIGTSGNIVLEATGNIDIKATGKASLKGTTVSIDGGPLTEVKGGIIKLN